MIERRRPIPVGELTREKECRFISYIGALSIMKTVGLAISAEPLPPTINVEANELRKVCRALGDDQFDDVRLKFENPSNDLRFMDMAHRIGFARYPQERSRITAPVIDGHARMAFDYMQGISPYYIPPKKESAIEHIIDFYANQTVAHIRDRAEITVDQTESETEVIDKARLNIWYEVMNV